MKLLLLIAANSCLVYSMPAAAGASHQDVLMDWSEVDEPIPPPCDHSVTTDLLHQTMQALVSLLGCYLQCY